MSLKAFVHKDWKYAERIKKIQNRYQTSIEMRNSLFDHSNEWSVNAWKLL